MNVWDHAKEKLSKRYLILCAAINRGDHVLIKFTLFGCWLIDFFPSLCFCRSSLPKFLVMDSSCFITIPSGLSLLLPFILGLDHCSPFMDVTCITKLDFMNLMSGETLSKGITCLYLMGTGQMYWKKENPQNPQRKFILLKLQAFVVIFFRLYSR